MTLSELAADAMKKLRELARPGEEIELYLSQGMERSIELREGALDGIQESSAQGAGLRVLREGRMGFACAGGADLETVLGLHRRAAEQLTHIESDPARAFADPGRAPEDSSELASSLWDDSLFQEPLESCLPQLKELEAGALRADARVSSVLRAGYSESRGEVVIANTRGLFCAERGASCSVGLSALAGKGGELQVGSAFQSARRRSALDFPRTARQAGERAAVLLGARKLPSGRRAVLIDPWVSGEFLDLLAGLLCADQVQRGKSLLAGRLGAAIGSDAVSLRDDPRRPEGLASSLYDDEGLPTRAKDMVDRGILKEFFFDCATAKKDGRQSNASASRGSFKGIPGPSCSNFFLAPGPGSREDLIGDTKDGVLVLDVMGMHTADPISGEFSVGVSGLAVKDGALAHPVSGAMISGNILDFLGRVDAVADDLTFYGGFGAPTFRVAHMTVA